MDWVAEAACAELTHVPWFYSDDPIEIKMAKEVCARCPVREQCLEFARANREPFGVWGGLTPEERGRQPIDVERCLACGGVLVPISETRDRCLACDSVWYR